MLSFVLIGGLLLVLLGVIFIGLKLGSIIAWSWWWVILPIWGVIGSVIGKLWIVIRDLMWRYRLVVVIWLPRRDATGIGAPHLKRPGDCNRWQRPTDNGLSSD